QGEAAAERALLQARARVFLRRPARSAQPRPHRRTQRRLRKRLPALRLDVAEHARGRGGADEAPRSRCRREDRPRQRDRVVRAVVRRTLEGLDPVAFDYLIKNATIVDGSGSAPYVGQVAIEGDRIASVMGAAASNGDQPDAATTY